MHSIVYTTVGDEAQADELAGELLRRGLVGCVNMFPIKSLYTWENELKKDCEFGIILKTHQDKVPKLIDVIEDIHPYEIPCVLELNVPRGSKAYLEWIDSCIF